MIDVVIVVLTASLAGMIPMVGLSLRLMIFVTMRIVTRRVGPRSVRRMALLLNLVLLPHGESSYSVISGVEEHLEPAKSSRRGLGLYADVLLHLVIFFAGQLAARVTRIQDLAGG